MKSRPGRVVSVQGPDGYMQWIAERLTEVEERLDLLEQARAQQEMSADPVELRPAAKTGEVEESGEFNN